MRYENTFFTSDTHFGHKNIIRYCGRPFADAVEMDRALIARWNESVGADDVVYHLGDFTLEGASFARDIFSQLNGRIRILGNHWHHDSRWLPRDFGPSGFRSKSGHPVEILPPVVVLRLPNGDRRKQGLVLCHYPFGEWDGKHHGAWHLHGHSHGTHHGRGAILDAGVDCHDFRPIPIANLPSLFSRRASLEREDTRAPAAEGTYSGGADT